MSGRQMFSWRGWHPVLGLLLCGTTASMTSFVFRDHAFKASLPLVFLAVVTVVALRFGSLAGVLGSCSAAVIFALLLFPPIGSLEVRDLHQRSNLGWFLVAGISISFLFASHSPGKQKAKSSKDSG
jgi:K+-sensing histidine kinase KdpD